MSCSGSAYPCFFVIHAVPPYCPDSKIDLNSLYRLEAAGLQPVKLVAEKRLRFMSMTMEDIIEDNRWRTPQQRVNVAVEKVASGWCDPGHAKTWKDLYVYMLGEETGAEIESFLNSKCNKCDVMRKARGAASRPWSGTVGPY